MNDLSGDLLEWNTADWAFALPLGDANDSPCPNGRQPQPPGSPMAEVAGVEPAVDNAPIPSTRNTYVASLAAEGV